MLFFALPLMAGAIAMLARLNALRDSQTPWADALLKSFTRGAIVFGVGVGALAAGVLVFFLLSRFG